MFSEDYRQQEHLDEAEIGGDPIAAVMRWVDDAAAAGIGEPNAMVLATVGADGRPSARTVLLKGMEARGFRFFTNYTSQKARELEARPDCALVFLWKEISRQARVEGRAERISQEDTAEYFASRPRGAQLGAWASPQSQVIVSRAVLEGRLAQLETQYPQGTQVPPPPHWGGYVVTPSVIELWLGQPDRLHDRLRYSAGADGAWRAERLAP